MNKHHSLPEKSIHSENLICSLYSPLSNIAENFRKYYINMNHIYSSREIEKACRRDTNFMWLLKGADVPDHATIARFRILYTYENNLLSIDYIMENRLFQVVIQRFLNLV